MKCFIIAMDSEAKPVIECMKVKKSYTYCDKKIYLGKLYGKKVAVAVCGVGKVNAASCTQYAIDRLKADTIVNIGVAGGLNGSMKVGNIYCVSEVVQYDFDLVQLNGTAIGTLNEFDKNYLPLKKAGGFMPKRVATGDRFNDNANDFLLLTETLDADIREMELGAIAQVCAHAQVDCYSFKAISDIAGSGSTTEQFSKNLQTCALSIKNSLRKITESVV